jgi:DMSO/TMAO reductase YedYZ molybdopterin-dependent catalytic subunit
MPDRRALLSGLAFTGLGLFTSACNRINESRWGISTLGSAEGLNRTLQRAFLRPNSMAREFSEADISPDFKANGSIDPPDADYRALKAGGFRDWRLTLDGLVERPMSLSLAQLRALPSRTQITRHDCVEGWSSIGQWKGVQLARLLGAARLKPEARYLVFHCMDTIDEAGGKPVKYYESLDLVDAVHPQTILAYEMNGRTLPVPHGAPLRLRVERQLGYKHAKYLHRIQAVDSLAPFGQGKGGYWEDVDGYSWFAGI